LLCAFGLTALGLWKPEPLPAAKTPAGRLARLDKNRQLDQPCPLEKTAATAEVQGPVARVRVRQTFRNPNARPIEDLYTFPPSAHGEHMGPLSINPPDGARRFLSGLFC